ncbi:MAG: hypothetical protein ACOYOA_14345 [Saprospiraceae bacterium]
MELFFEIIKYTLPALITGLTAFYLFRNFFEFQIRVKAIENKNHDRKITLPMRLQSYERLSLFCERISVANLIMRLKSPEASASSLQYAMMIAIQQEFEHNVSQQVYVSDALWQIIRLTKDNMMAVISEVGGKMDKKDTADQLTDALFKYFSENPSATDTALAAIRQECGDLF